MSVQVETEYEYEVVAARIDYLIELEDPTEEEMSELEYLEAIVSDWEEELGLGDGY